MSTIAASNAEVKDTAYDEYFSVNFDTIEPKIRAVGTELIEALSPVYGQAMTGHTVLDEGLVQVDYEKHPYQLQRVRAGDRRRGCACRGLAPYRGGDNR